MREWTFEELKAWLEGNMMGFLVEPLEEMALNGEVFAALTESELIEDLVRLLVIMLMMPMMLALLGWFLPPLSFPARTGSLSCFDRYFYVPFSLVVSFACYRG